MKSAAATDVQAGDTIKWVYTTDKQKHPEG